MESRDVLAKTSPLPLSAAAPPAKVRPDRRPYATTLPYGGYVVRPSLIAPRPLPALHVLAASFAVDEPRETPPRQDGSHLTAPPTAAATHDLVCDRARASSKAFPDVERTAAVAVESASLQHPIQHAERDYHGSQQAALNAELRFKVESTCKDILRSLDELQTRVREGTASQPVNHFHVLDGLKAYWSAYRTSDRLPPTPFSELLHGAGHLHATPPLLHQASSASEPDLDTIRRALDALLMANERIAEDLSPCEAPLVVLNEIAALPLASPLAAEVREDGSTARPSAAAVALHARLHYNPSAYSLEELRRTDEAIAELERCMALAAERKAYAISKEETVDAFDNLRVEFNSGNELLLLTRSRMAVIDEMTKDVQKLRAAVIEAIDGAAEAAAALSERPADLLPRVEHDRVALQNAIDETDARTQTALEAERAAQAELLPQLNAIEDEEKALWDILRDTVQRLEEAAQVKERVVRDAMSARERRARVIAELETLRKDQEKHLERVQDAEVTALRWSSTAKTYQHFIDAFAPKLLQHVNTVEAQRDRVFQDEVNAYVRRYENFVHVAEEARARQNVQADRMRLWQRTMALHESTATVALDPDAKHYVQRATEARQEMVDAEAYGAYVTAIAKDRRAEIEPLLQEVLHGGGEGEAEEVKAVQEHSTGDLEDGISIPSHSETSPSCGSLVPQAAAAEVAAAALDHPALTARIRGLAHEGEYVEKHKRFAGAELDAVEAKRTQLRLESKGRVGVVGKIRSAEYIKELLCQDENTLAA